jgi:hypothetical protein
MINNCTIIWASDEYVVLQAIIAASRFICDIRNRAVVEAS